MKIALKIFTRLACLSLLLSQGCEKEAKPVRLQWPVMGTVAAVQCVDALAAPQARTITQEVFAQVNEKFSTRRTDSEISTVNKAAGSGTAVTVSPEIMQVLETDTQYKQFLNNYKENK